MTSTVPSRARKVEMVVLGAAWAGLAVWAKPRVVWIEMTSPAVDREARNRRRMAPIISPIRVSRMTAPAPAPRVAGTTTLPATSGVRMKAISRANDRRMRGGTLASPKPGTSMTMAPIRANTRPAA